MLLFIILFLHQTTTARNVRCSADGCLSSCSYIKPQRQFQAQFKGPSCLSSCSYIKPQLEVTPVLNTVCCLSSCSYIKPQLIFIHMKKKFVVYHLVPTSNHNRQCAREAGGVLFIILFLHQTTTQLVNFFRAIVLFIILFLHQTTTYGVGNIKYHELFIILFLHQTTTSKLPAHEGTRLFIILFLHQTTTTQLSLLWIG